eukprot:3671891-Rhodomonas_salina.1
MCIRDSPGPSSKNSQLLSENLSSEPPNPYPENQTSLLNPTGGRKCCIRERMGRDGEWAGMSAPIVLRLCYALFSTDACVPMRYRYCPMRCPVLTDTPCLRGVRY